MNEPGPTRDDCETVAHGATDAGAADGPAIAGYEILGVLGRGGMGVVYLARQVSLNRLVAVKMILAGEHASPMQRERFLAEAEAVARLRHPGVVQIHEIGQAGGQPYFALEYLPGGTLAQRIAGTPQPPREAAALVEGLARAIHAAHVQGVVHRDLKPANVLFAEATTPERSEQAKIADFGLAKLLDDEASPTRSGTVLGTASYMAPEQASGHSKQVGPATDVYALGAILYEMLTGRPPFRAAAMVETLRQVVAEEAVPARRLNPAVPRDLDTICAKCLRKPTGQRYASAAELADDLCRYLRGEPVRARPVHAGERLVKWVRRNPVVTGLLVALVLFAVGAAVLAVLAVQSATNEALARQDAETNARQAIDRLYIADLNLTQRAWQERQYDWARELLDGQLPEHTGARDLRRFEWYYWHRCLHLPRWVTRGTDRSSRVAFNPDGTWAAVCYKGGAAVTLYDLATGKEHETPLDLPDRDADVVSLRFSQDGKRLAVATLTGKVFVYDLTARRLLATLPWRANHGARLCFAAEGRYLVTAPLINEGAGVIWDVAAGREVARLEGARRFHHLDSSPDGTRIVGVGPSEPARVWDARTGQEQLTVPKGTGHIAVAFSPDGNRIAMIGGDPDHRGPTLAFADAATGVPQGTRPFSADFQPYFLAYSADGGRLVVVGDPDPRVLDAATGEELLILRGHRFPVDGAALNSDGRRAVTHSQDAEAMLIGWDVTQGAEYRLLRGHTAQVACVAFGPDRQLLASGGSDQTLRVWDTAEGRAVCVLPVGGPVRRVAFTADGTRLVAASGAIAARRIHLFEVATGKPLASWPMANPGVRGPFLPALACRHDGTVAHSAAGPNPGDKEVIQFRDPDGVFLFSLEPPEAFISHLAFSPDGRWLVSCGGAAAYLWDVAERSVRFTLGGHGAVSAAAFSADGGRLITGGRDGVARVWDVATGEEGPILRGHKGGIAGVAFTGDGDRIITAVGMSGNGQNPDSSVRVWEARTGRELLRLACPEGGCLGFAVSPDGQRIVTVPMGSHSLLLWDAPR